MSLRLCIILLLFCFHYTVSGKVIIRGKINNYDGKTLIYYHPTIEGIYAPYSNKVKPLPNGNFRIEFENIGLGNVKINYKMLLYRFFHDENSQIYFEFNDEGINRPKKLSNDLFLTADSLKHLVTIKISGDYNHINEFYNRNLRSSYSTTRSVSGNYYSQFIYEAKSPYRASQIIDSLSNREIEQINELPWQINSENPTVQKKQEEIRAFLVNEVHAFYGAIFINGMFLKRKEQVTIMMNDSVAKPDIYSREWEQMIEQLTLDVKNDLMPIPNSPDYNDFMESMLYTLKNYKTYDFPQNPPPLDEMMIDLLFKYDTVFLSDKDSRFANELSVINRFLNDQLFYSPALLQAMYAMQAKYPKSANLDYYKPQIEKLKTNLETAQQGFDEGKIISANLNSFQSLIKRFEGKNLLVDIWATWCHPCIEDMRSKDVIKPFTESKSLEVLYISIDKPEWEDRWRQSIKINQLEGYHFRANSKFITDMWNVIGDFKGAIPRYVLIDKTGNIFKSTAARPSMGEELPKQIEELIAKMD